MNAVSATKIVALATLSLLASAGLYAKSLNVKLQGGATYSFQAAESNGIAFETRTIDNQPHYYISVGGHDFDLGDVEVIYVSSEVMPANGVSVLYNDAESDVIVDGHLVPYVEVDRAGANVTVRQSTDVSDDVCGEITYTLSGVSADGSFKLSGDYKSTLVLNGLNLTSLTTAPVYIDNGKRIALKLTEGTDNALSDAPGGSHKGTIHCKGHLEFKQKGSLTLSGKTSHAVYSKEYVQLKNSNITITDAVKDGINCAQYFLMESGTLNILSSGDDGVQVGYKDAEPREAEDTGSLTIKNGTVNIVTTADAAKCLKADNDIVVSGGKLNLEVRGNGLWDATKLKTKAAACLGADGNLSINGGDMTLTASGSGGKGASCDGNLQINDGTIRIRTSGGLLVYSNGTLSHNYTGNTDRIASDYKSSPKGMKADGTVEINGGKIDIYTSSNGAEGIESKSTLAVHGGDINIKAYDDGINSALDMTIDGGTLSVVSTAGDGLDSNANIIIAGGEVRTFGAGGMECGLDASTETGCSVRFTGGSILAAGGGSSAPTSVATTQPYVAVSGLTLKAGQEVTVKSGDTVLGTLTVPAYYGVTTTPLDVPAARGALFGPGGGGWPGGMGSSGTVISVPGMVSGQSYTVTVGTVSVTATAKLK